MSHCTRVGNQYIGSAIESLLPPQLSEITGTVANSATSDALRKVQEMVDWYYQNKWIKNANYGENDKACDCLGTR